LLPELDALRTAHATADATGSSKYQMHIEAVEY